jgi:hypothetical protein
VNDLSDAEALDTFRRVVARIVRRLLAERKRRKAKG